MDRMRKELQKKTAPANAPEPKTAEPAPDESSDGASASDGEAAPSAQAAKKGKANPWKLVDEYKAKASTLEQQLSEAKKAVVDPKEKEEITGKLTEAQKRLAELEEEIKYVNYSKSSEFSEKYQKPYEESWKKAMAELGELTVADEESGSERPIAPNDILALVNLPLKEARARAVELYGDFADDVMSHRKEIRNLFDAQGKALDQARKAGLERDETRSKQMQEMRSQTTRQISEMWSKFNQEAVADKKFGKYFQPVEGDEEGNKRLARGYEIADQAFARSPLDPNLTPEQRAEVVRHHSALRHRAAAFGRTAYQLDQANSKIASLEKELAKYKSTQPGSGEGGKTEAPVGGSSAKASVMGALRKYAH